MALLPHTARTVGPSASLLDGPSPSSLIARVAPPSAIHRTDRADDRLVISAMVVADLFALALACLVALVIRQNLAFLEPAPQLSESVLRLSVVIVAAWMLAILISGASNPRLVGAGPEIYRNALVGSLIAVGIVGSALFLADIPLSRPFFVTLFLVGPPLLLLVRLATRRGVNLARTRGRLRSQVLVVGSTGHVRGIVRTLTREVWLGYDVVGAVAPINDERREDDAGVPILGDESQLLDLVRVQQQIGRAHV